MRDGELVRSVPECERCGEREAAVVDGTDRELCPSCYFRSKGVIRTDGGREDLNAGTSQPEPAAFAFLEGDYFQREPNGEECVICGDEPDPYHFDAIPVETPDGTVYLNLGDPSCMDCRKDVIRQLSARGLQQEGLNAFA